MQRTLYPELIMTSYSGTVYPNGEFTIGHSANRLERDDVAVSRQKYSDDEEFMTKALAVHGYEALAIAFGGEAPLGLSSVPISHKRAQKGLKGLTSQAGRKIRNAAFILEEKFGRRRCGFGTVTLPELTPEDYINVHSNWGNIVRTYMQWVQRRLVASGVAPYTFHVSEIQVKRHEQSGTPYLHLHYCYPARPKSNYKWYLPASEARVAWERAVSAFCTSSYDFAASVDSVVVKAPLGRYLAKYLSKGADSIERALRDGLPTGAVGHWWGWSREARSSVSSRTIRATGLVERIWTRLDEWVIRGWVTSVYFIYIPTRSSGDRCIGMCGVLAKKAMDMISSTYGTSNIACNEKTSTRIHI